ncbi:nucleotidyltransferase domain-containing protein [Pantoea agglomerans]|uniref:nucleotidyltransferase domain-containing protein n=1 Tax=Enterobacter agglomerans TaxID=549 RepID=UPI003C7B69B8
MYEVLNIKKKEKNLESFLCKNRVCLEDIKSKVKRVFASDCAFIGGSIIYGINNIYSDIDVLVVVESDEEEKPAQLTQLDIEKMRLDCRTISRTRIKSAIENINNKSKIIIEGKNPFRIGLKSDIHEALDRVSNGISLYENPFMNDGFEHKLALILTFDRINDYFGIYQDAVGALYTNQIYYAFTRTLECAAKIVDIFLSSNGYINASVKTRILALELYYNGDKITKWYKEFIEEFNFKDNVNLVIEKRLKEMNLMIIDLQLKKLNMIKEIKNGTVLCLES